MKLIAKNDEMGLEVRLDKAVLKRSLEAIKKREFTWVCPAHGEPVRRESLWEALLG